MKHYVIFGKNRHIPIPPRKYRAKTMAEAKLAFLCDTEATSIDFGLLINKDQYSNIALSR